MLAEQEAELGPPVATEKLLPRLRRKRFLERRECQREKEKAKTGAVGNAEDGFGRHGLFAVAAAADALRDTLELGFAVGHKCAAEGHQTGVSHHEEDRPSNNHAAQHLEPRWLGICFYLFGDMLGLIKFWFRWCFGHGWPGGHKLKIESEQRISILSASGLASFQG